MMHTWSLQGLSANISGRIYDFLVGLTHRPGHDYDLPLVGCPNPADCREYSCAADCSEATEVPNPTEPSLSDDELVAVRGLIQERYDPKLTGQCTETLESAGSLYFCDLTHGHTGMHTSSGGPSWFVGETNFAGAAASLADENNSPGVLLRSSVREDKQRTYGHSSAWSSVDPHAQSVPASSAAGASPSGVDSFPPNPPEGPLSFEAWVIPAILTVLGEHQPTWHVKRLECWATDGTSCGWFADSDEWREHVAPLIAQHVEQALLSTDFPQ
jgi:hypothetical protein